MLSLGSNGSTVSTDSTDSLETKALVERSGSTCGLENEVLVLGLSSNVLNGHFQEEFSTAQSSQQSNLGHVLKDNAHITGITASWKGIEFLGEASVCILGVRALLDS